MSWWGYRAHRPSHWLLCLRASPVRGWEALQPKICVANEQNPTTKKVNFGASISKLHAGEKPKQNLVTAVEHRSEGDLISQVCAQNWPRSTGLRRNGNQHCFRHQSEIRFIFLVWGHSVSFSQGHSNTMNSLKTSNFSPTSVPLTPNRHWNTDLQIILYNGSSLHFPVPARQNSSLAFQDLLCWSGFVKLWLKCLSYSTVTLAKAVFLSWWDGCQSLAAAPDQGPWRIQHQNITEDNRPLFLLAWTWFLLSNYGDQRYNLLRGRIICA